VPPFKVVRVSTYPLVGAAIITAQSNSQLCNSITGDSGFPSFTSSQESPCASSQVLQAFTWISAILLLGYFTFLSILTIVKYREDPTVLHCRVHRFPLVYERRALKSVPTSPAQPRFRAQSPPVIAAPRPRRLAQLREAVLSHPSSLTLDYEIEHYQGGPTLQAAQATSNDGHAFAPQFARATSDDMHTQVLHGTSNDRRAQFPQATSSDGHTFAIHIPQTAASPPPPLQPVRNAPQQMPQATYSSPFYHSAVKTAINKAGPQIPPPVQVNQPRQLPPSPPPLGDWPRLDATSRPRTKRKPLPRPLPGSEAQAEPPSETRITSQPQGPSRPNPARGQPHSRALPAQPPGPAQPEQYALDATALTAALQPLAAQPSSWRSKPSGPRRSRQSDSIDDGRPAALDLSNISSFRTPGFGPR
jgi:hypothetical protein